MRVYFLLLVIIYLTLHSCASIVTKGRSVTVTDFEISKIKELNDQKKILENEEQTPETIADLKQINAELVRLERKVCLALGNSNICGECSKCNNNCSRGDRVNDWLNCSIRGVLAGGDCESCPTIPLPLKHILILNPQILSSKITTKVIFRDVKTNKMIKTFELRNTGLKKTNMGKFFKENIKSYKILNRKEYNITVEEHFPDGTKEHFTISNYSLIKK